jgi:hypothetical protein
MYETGFFLTFTGSTTSNSVYTRNIGLPGPGIIIRLIRTVVIGQITP